MANEKQMDLSIPVPWSQKPIRITIYTRVALGVVVAGIMILTAISWVSSWFIPGS